MDHLSHTQVSLATLLALPRKKRLMAFQALPKNQRDAIVGLLKTECSEKDRLSLTTAERHPELLLPNAVNAILKSFPEPPREGLAIDHDFDTPEERLDAIIEDINAGRFPSYRLPELIHENFFNDETFYDETSHKTFTQITAHSFLTYAIPKIKDLRTFVTAFSEALGPHDFALYLQTPSAWTEGHFGEATLQTIDARGFYLSERRSQDASEALSAAQRNLLQTLLPDQEAIQKQTEAVDVQRVDTHIDSSHQSADESHLRALKRFMERHPGLLEAEFPPEKRGVRPKVTLLSHKAFDAFVQGRNQAFLSQLTDMVSMERGTLFENYLRHGEIEAISHKQYHELSTIEREAIDAKLDGLLFMAQAAHRYMHDMVHHHACPFLKPGESSEHSYETNTINNCGLTIEQMIAVALDASEDTACLKTNIHPAVMTMMFVKALHDMRRGYNIDRGIDRPEENIFPQLPGQDFNRCRSGAANGAAFVLNGVHTLYEMKMIRSLDIVFHLSKVYEEITEKYLPDLQQRLSPSDVSRWKMTKKPTASVRQWLQAIFNKDYLQETEKTFRGYIRDTELDALIADAPNHVPCSKALVVEMRGIESLDFEGIYSAIANKNLPFITFDPKQGGYQSTLGFLSSFPDKARLAEFLFDKALQTGAQNEGARTVLSFLSRSNAPESIMQRDIGKLQGKPISLRSIQGLNPEETRLLFTTEARYLLHRIIDAHHPRLLLLYAEKTKIGDPNPEIPNLLYRLVISDSKDCLQTLLDSLTPQKILDLLTQKDLDGCTAIACVIRQQNNDHLMLIFDKIPSDKILDCFLQDENTRLNTVFLSEDPESLRLIANKLTPDQALKFYTTEDSSGNSLIDWTIFLRKPGYLEVIFESLPPEPALALIFGNNNELLEYLKKKPDTLCAVFNTILEKIPNMDTQVSASPSPTPRLVLETAIARYQRFGIPESIASRTAHALARLASVMPALQGQESIEEGVAFERNVESVLKKIVPRPRQTGK